MVRRLSLLLAFASVLIVASPAWGAGITRDRPQAEIEVEAHSDAMLRLRAAIAALDPDFQQAGSMLVFLHRGVEMLCITDPSADRMRLMARVAPADTLEAAQLVRLMEANFHTALDARYALSHGVLFALYVHPLSSLSAAEFKDAARQVALLRQTFGGLYTSGPLRFNGPYEDALTSPVDALPRS